jgi:hypothetical protein
MMVTEVQKQRVLRRIDGFFQLLFIFIRPIAVTMRLQADGSTQHTMSNTTSPVGAVEPFASPDDPTSLAAPERRESEKVITDWDEETRRLGRALALMTLDFSAMTGPKWAHRFIISVGRVAEDCVLLFYGARFGALMELPANPEYSVPVMADFPARYAPVFAKGCMDAMLQGGPVRIQGAVDRQDGQQELYRAAFVRLSIDAKRVQRLALGAFNCRVIERRA